MNAHRRTSPSAMGFYLAKRGMERPVEMGKERPVPLVEVPHMLLYRDNLVV